MKVLIALALLAGGIIMPGLAFAEQKTIPVEVDGTQYQIQYDASGLTVDGIEADTSTATLTIAVTTGDVSGTLKITLERSFFDSKENGADDPFLVLADFQEAEFTEQSDASSRTLTITVPAGTVSIDIIGSGFGIQPEPQAPEETPSQPQPPAQTPPETPQEPQPPAEQKPEVQCGPGTILKDGVCVLQEPPTQAPTQEPQKQKPTTVCGPGTVLKDGVCVLEQVCGPGTVLKDGQCVAEAKPARSITYDFVVPAIAAFIVAFIVMIILWAIGKAARKKNG